MSALYVNICAHVNVHASKHVCVHTVCAHVCACVREKESIRVKRKGIQVNMLNFLVATLKKKVKLILIMSFI